MTDPGLAFWIHHVETEGGLVEQDGRAVLAVLPFALQNQDGLPEDVLATADPDVAREEPGSLLLVAGNPLLLETAERVLSDGDVGHVRLRWPETKQPDADQMLEHARNQVHFDHGRIDREGIPLPVYIPVIRIGAQMTYSVSFDERFQEAAEVWVATQPAALLDDEVADLLSKAVRDPDHGPPRHRVLAADVEAALRVGEASLATHTRKRLEELALSSRELLAGELDRAERYYNESLGSLRKRIRTAAEDRKALLETQVESVTTERQRRLAEIEEKFRPDANVNPFRMHHVGVPGYVLKVTVRRGSRAYPLTLHWLCPTARFAQVVCPHCAAPKPLVAGKDRLGCMSCLPPKQDPIPEQVEVVEKKPEPVATPTAKVTRPSVNSSSASPRRSARHNRDIERTANERTMSTWQHVADRKSLPAHKLARESPAAIAYELYGHRAPLYVLALPGNWQPDAIRHNTDVDGRWAITQGVVTTDDEGKQFELLWAVSETGSLTLAEIRPGRWQFQLQLRLLSRQSSPEAPPPDVELDDVEQAVWAQTATTGLTLVLRCCAAWARGAEHAIAEQQVLVDTHGPEAIATALIKLVSGWSEIRLTTDRVDQSVKRKLSRLLDIGDASSRQGW